MVKFLLENGADVKIKDNTGKTVLYYSIKHNSFIQENAIKILNLLIKYGADVNTKDNYRESLLSISYADSSYWKRNKEIFKVLVENGFDLETRIENGSYNDCSCDYDYNYGYNYDDDYYDYTPLMIAASRNDYDMVKFLVEKGADVNAKTHYESEYSRVVTPLLLSLDRHHYESGTAEFLINNGADINVRDDNGNTPLIYAAETHNTKVIELLIQKNADINAVNNDGSTALMLAVNNLETVKLLAEKGADVNFQASGSTALISACKYRNRNIDVIKYLVSKKADINAQDDEGYTALNKTLDSMGERLLGIRDFEIANFLIEQGADVNIKNEGLYTPLIYLGMSEGNFNNKNFQEKRIKLAELLLEKGADINAQDYNGYTSLIWACSTSGSRFAEPFVKFLVEKGADVNIKNDYGETALNQAEILKLRGITGILKKAQRNRN